MKREITVLTEFVLFFIFCVAIFLYIRKDADTYKVKKCDPPVIIERTVYIDKPIIYTNIKDNVSTMEYDTLDVSESEKELLARVIMSEGSLLPRHGKLAILATIINRVNSTKYPDTIKEVVYQENQYSMAYNGEPTEECYAVINDFIYGAFPEDMYYFRNDHPHSFAYEYCTINNVYFSCDTNHLVY